jgi:hypothetical protein
MPRFRTFLPGIVLLLACACGGGTASNPSPSPSPSPTRVPTPIATPVLGAGYAPWLLSLDFSGDLTGHVAGTAAPDDLIRDECTGKDSARLTGQWASTMAVNIGQQRYALVVLIDPYKGAGVFTANLKVEVHSADQAKVWHNGPGDPVSLTVGTDEQSGLLDATITNAATGSSKVRVAGRWSCQP